MQRKQHGFILHEGSIFSYCPDGWLVSNIYTSKLAELDLSDPKKNAEMLSKMDFDDGCGGWRR